MNELLRNEIKSVGKIFQHADLIILFLWRYIKFSMGFFKRIFATKIPDFLMDYLEVFIFGDISFLNNIIHQFY
jgi:hypothetical protein